MKALIKGDIIASLYEIHEILSGGKGNIYICYHKDRKKFYALKTIKEEYFYSKDEFQAFQRETELWIGLGKHPNIVQALTLRDFGGRIFLVLEYIEPDSMGRNNLSHYLDPTNPLDIQQVMRWSLQFCDAMIYARKKIRCHNDIKPSNIMITKDSVLKVTDFGFSMPILRDSREDNISLGRYEISQDMWFKGTLEYMSPEAFINPQSVDEISDIYSFGVVLFQMISNGRLPFIAKRYDFDSYKYLHNHESLSELDTPLFPVINRCMAKQKRDRYQSFSELRKEIANYYRCLIGKNPSRPMKTEFSSEDIRHFSQALYELNHFHEALNYCERAIVMNRNDYEAWNIKGIILNALGKHDEALLSFQESIKTNPDYYHALINMGKSLRKKNLLDEAIKSFEKALSLKPDQTIALNNIGACFQMQGKYLEAIEYYRKAIELDSYYRNAYVNMADCYISLKNYPQALNCYEKANKIDPYDSYIYKKLEELKKMNV